MSDGLQWEKVRGGGIARKNGEHAMSYSAIINHDHLMLNAVNHSFFSNYKRYGKRLFDIVFSLIFLCCGGLFILAFIAMLIKLDSPGPAFFSQKRIGYCGKIFICRKFRTMRHDPMAKFAQASRNDPRITRVGRFLRKTNLDELPQFLNVLGGSMSVVGPRPHVPELDEAFVDRVPGYKYRTLTRPGVTGLAQISGCRGETRSVREMNHRVRFDVFYIRSTSFFLDVSIIFRTIKKIFVGDDNAF
jgi:lipopolysaccharide/colanic/teichoic acid biosynthesis glycosyltransferase